MAILSKKTIQEITVLGVLILVVSVGLQASFGTLTPFYVVASGSMIPELQVHDLIVIQANRAFAEVQTGDVIVYERPSDHDRVIVHRVASIIDDEPRTIRTKGDANPASIPGTDFPITENEYLGTVFFVIPQAGYVSQILQPPINLAIIGAIIGIILFKKFKKN